MHSTLNVSQLRVVLLVLSALRRTKLERIPVAMKAWLDDERPAPDGWVHVKTTEDAIELLRGGEVTELSLDHDLGLAAPECERTGDDVLVWRERMVVTEGWSGELPAIAVHSANPVGQKRMALALESIQRRQAT
jgi:hypothetical protein